MADSAPQVDTSLLDDPSVLARARAAGQTPEDYLRAHPDGGSAGAPAAEAKPSDLFNAVKATNPPPATPPVAPSASANTATPGELDTLASKLKAGQGGTQPPKGNGAEMGPPASAAGPSTPAAPAVTDATEPGQGEAGAVAAATKAASGAATGPAAAAAPATPRPAKTPPAEAPPATPTEARDALRAMVSAASKAGPDYKASLDKLGELGQSYRQAYAEQKDTLQKQELAEKFGHALAQLGAGIQGQRSGYDTVSNLKFDKTDWTRKYETALAELRDNLQDVQGQRGTAERLESEREAKATTGQAELAKGEGELQRERETQAASNTREREQRASSERVAKTYAGAKLGAAEVNAQGRKSIADLRANTSMSLEDKREAAKASLLDQAASLKQAGRAGSTSGHLDPGQVAVGGVSQAMTYYAAGNTKLGDSLMAKHAAAARAYLGPKAGLVDDAIRDAKDSQGFFGADDAKLKGAQASLTGASPATPSRPAAQPRAVSAAELAEYAKAQGASEEDAAAHLSSLGYKVQR